MKWISALVMVLVSAVLLVTQSGCLVAAAAGAAAGTVMYVRGDMTANVDAGLDRTLEATKAAMNDLNYPIIYAGVGANSAERHVEASIGTDNKANVTIKYLTDKTSEVQVRIGTFGNEPLSRQILERIQSHLKAGA